MSKAGTDSGVLEGMIEDSSMAVASLKAQSAALAGICDAVIKTLKSGGKVLTAGNGGSSCEALHMTEELVGRFRKNRQSLHSVCLAADPTVLTCIGNDFGFDAIFSRQVEGTGSADDILVLFSTSGNSENLVKAAEAAKKKNMAVVCLLGRGGGRLAGRGDFQIIVDSQTTERVQEVHQVIMHIILDAVEKAFPA